MRYINGLYFNKILGEIMLNSGDTPIIDFTSAKTLEDIVARLRKKTE